MVTGFVGRDVSLKIKKTFVLFVFLAAVGGGRVLAEEARPPKFRVLTTVFPLEEFARAVADDRAEITMLLPPGAEVHTWQPRVSDIKKFSDLDVFIYIGGNLEPWAHDILRSVARPGLKIVEAGRGLVVAALGADEHGAKEADDPHIWLDFAYDQILIDRIQAALAEVEPAGAQPFKKAAEIYKEKLRLLDQEYRNALQSCDRRTFIFAGHSALRYLARRYSLDQVSVYGISPDAAPTPRQLAGIISLAKQKNIKTIFFEPSAGDKLARMIAAEVGADVRPLYPGHNLTPDERRSKTTFLDLMERNLENLRYGLGCH